MYVFIINLEHFKIIDYYNCFTYFDIGCLVGLKEIPVVDHGGISSMLILR